MVLKLVRRYRGKTYTIGDLYVNGKLFCQTLEDTDRNLKNTDPLSKIKATKVYGETAIPTGEYVVRLDVVSPKYSNFTRYPYAKAYNGKMPRILMPNYKSEVPGWQGVLIHPGNSNENTLGCVLVGLNTNNKNWISNSQVTWINLMETMKGQEVKLIIEWQTN